MRFIALYRQLWCYEIRRKLLFIEVHSLVKFKFSLLKPVNGLIKYSPTDGLHSLS